MRILLEHIKTGKRYGDIAIEKGFMTQEQIRKVLEAQSRDSVMLGKILVQNGALTKSQVFSVSASGERAGRISSTGTAISAVTKLCSP